MQIIWAHDISVESSWAEFSLCSIFDLWTSSFQVRPWWFIIFFCSYGRILAVEESSIWMCVYMYTWFKINIYGMPISNSCCFCLGTLLFFFFLFFYGSFFFLISIDWHIGNINLGFLLLFWRKYKIILTSKNALYDHDDDMYNIRVHFFTLHRQPGWHAKVKNTSRKTIAL